MAKTYYRLGGNASFFFDPTQPNESDKSLLVHEAKELAETKNVQVSYRAGGLVKLTETEAQEFLSEAQLKAQQAKESSAANLEAAAGKEEQANVILREAKLLHEDVKQTKVENDELRDENQQMKDRIAELEAAAAGTAPDEKGGKKGKGDKTPQ